VLQMACATWTEQSTLLVPDDPNDLALTLFTPQLKRLYEVPRAVGTVLVEDASDGDDYREFFVGTAWVVRSSSESLHVVTNAHVLEVLRAHLEAETDPFDEATAPDDSSGATISGLTTGALLLEGLSSRKAVYVDFSNAPELQAPGAPSRFLVTAYEAHGFYDLAVLRLAPREGQPHALHVCPAPSPTGAPVFAVGFPDDFEDIDPLELIFPGGSGFKRYSPGHHLDVPEGTCDGTPWADAHDGSTAARSSGSPIIDLNLGCVAALHVGAGEIGRYNCSLAHWALIAGLRDLQAL